MWIVIVTFNSADDIVECLESIDSKEFRILIVDNNSSDRTARILRAFRRRVSVLKNTRNVGFARAINRGVRFAIRNGADYVAVLNPDTVVKGKAFERLLEFLSKDDSVGIVGPAVEHFDSFRRRRVWDLGGRVNWTLGRAAHLNVVDLKGYLEARRRDYVSGCCMVIKTTVFSVIGTFDERFFMYYEDVDFCTRARIAGFSVWNFPRARIYHKYARSSGGLTYNSAYHLTRSALLFGEKWLSFQRRALAVLWVLVQSLLFMKVGIGVGMGAVLAMKDYRPRRRLFWKE